MAKFTVRWEIEIAATSHAEAAKVLDKGLRTAMDNGDIPQSPRVYMVIDTDSPGDLDWENAEIITAE